MLQSKIQVGGMFHLFVSGMENIPKCIYFILSAEEEILDWLVNCWRGPELLNIVKWREKGPWKWALHVNLTIFDKIGEEVVLPFIWDKKNKPLLLEGILAWKQYAKGN